jgi:tetraprenyl-beta-curcumene synthase
VQRVGAAQTLNHQIPLHGEQPLRAWSETHTPPGYRWWETAAAGISCLGIHALLAGAAENGYWVPVCAISALLDSLIDEPRDTGTNNHSFIAHYQDDAAARFSAIVHDARRQLGMQRSPAAHRVILAGIVGFYLGAPEARLRPDVRRAAITAAGWPTWPIVLAMWARRAAHRQRFSRRGIFTLVGIFKRAPIRHDAPR